MSRRYLLNTFSPSMLGEGMAFVAPIDVTDAIRFLAEADFISAISHEVTAAALRQMIEAVAGEWDDEAYASHLRGVAAKVTFNRVNVTLESGDSAIAAIPQFRADKSREFTAEEIANANWRFFLIVVIERG